MLHAQHTPSDTLSAVSALAGEVSGFLTQLLHIPEPVHLDEWHPEAVFTPREWAITWLIAWSLTHKQVARVLGISHRTVSNLLGRVFIYFGIRSVDELRRLIWASGWLRYIPPAVADALNHQREGV